MPKFKTLLFTLSSKNVNEILHDSIAVLKKNDKLFNKKGHIHKK